MSHSSQVLVGAMLRRRDCWCTLALGVVVVCIRASHRMRQAIEAGDGD